MTDSDRAIAQQALDTARATRLEFCVFRHNVDVPGETAALARLLFLHVPEMARRMGVEIGEDEGHPPSVRSSPSALGDAVARDMVAARPYEQWLRAHLSPAARQVFAQGADNALTGLLDAHAAVNGFQRADALAVEGGRSAARSAALSARLDPGREPSR